MLAYILALVVALGSFALYMAAFFFPEVHRKNDFIWSGVGFFYALVLWVCAGRITGGVLLGQIACVSLLGWLAWQTLTLRRQILPVGQQTEIPTPEKLQEQLSNVSLPAGINKVPERLTSSLKNVFGRVQETIGGMQKAKENQKASGGSKPEDLVKVIDNREKESVTPKTPTMSEENQPKITVTETQTTPVTEVFPLGAEPTPVSEQPAGPDMPSRSPTASASISEIAPEVELAPPAEPVGVGAPQERQAPLEATVVKSAPGETADTTPASLSSPETETPELVHPNPPEPEVVEAAVEDAQEKGIPASPPETEENI